MLVTAGADVLVTPIQTMTTPMRLVFVMVVVVMIKHGITPPTDGTTPALLTKRFGAVPMVVSLVGAPFALPVISLSY